MDRRHPRSLMLGAGLVGALVASVAVPGAASASDGVPQVETALPSATHDAHVHVDRVDALGVELFDGADAEPAASNLNDALTAAATLGERVEIADWTSETGRHLANPDGTILFESYAMPQRVRRDGAWVPVDPTLIRAGDRVIPVATTMQVDLSAGGTGELIRMVDGDRVLSLWWAEPLPEPVLAGDTATYHEVMPGVDLVIQMDVDSFIQVLRVKHVQAAANPELARLTWQTSTENLSLQVDPSGGLVAVDVNTDEVVFAAPPSVMWDSPLQDSAMFAAMGESPLSSSGLGDGPEPGQVRLIATELDDGELAVLPDTTMLADPHTVYPVYIDPGFTGGIWHWANVFKQSPNQGWTNDGAWPRSGGMRVGLLDWPGCGDGCGLWRSVVRFHVDDRVHGRHVVSAAVRMTQTHTGGCGEYYIQLWQVNSFTSGVSWNNVSWMHGDYLQRRLVASSNSAGGCSVNYPNRSVTFNNSKVISSVQNAAKKEYLSVSYGVRSNNEGSRNQWRRISRESLRLEVTYDAYPNSPTNVTIAGGSADCHGSCSSPATVRVTRPYLQGRVSKSLTSDFPNIRAEFELRNYSTGSVVATHRTSLQSSPRTFEWRAPTLTNGTQYRYRVRGVNSNGGTGPWSSYFRFTVNTAGPQTPTSIGVDSTGSCYPAAACASPAMLNDRRPTFRATPRHPLGDDTTVVFEVRNSDRSQVIATGTVNNASHNTKVTWRPSTNLPQEATMHMRVRSTNDKLGRSGSWSSYFTFTVDTNPPNPPGVSSTLYAHKDTGTWNGGVGQPGTFTFSPNGSADVVTYQWRLNGGDVTSADVSKGTSHTVTLTPPGDLEQVLEVRTLDHAGNISPWRTYAFYVRPQPADAGYWKFDEGAGDVAGSAVPGSEINGVLRGGAIWAPSGINPDDPQASGSAVLLNGTDAYVEMPPVLATNHAAGYTVSAWVNPSTLTGSHTVVAQRGDNTYNFRLYHSSSSNQWCFQVRHADDGAATTTQTCADLTPEASVWTHLVGVYDNPQGKLRLWVNGGPNNGRPQPGAMSESDAPTAWAATGSYQVGRAFAGDYFAGRVDEVRAQQRVLEEFEVVQVYRSCLLASCPPVPQPDALTLVGAWGFEERTGDVAEDSSGMNNPATRHGGSDWTAFGLGGTRGVSLDGQSGYLATDGHVLLTDQSFTVSAWARLDHLPSGDRAVIAQVGSEVSVVTLEYRSAVGQWCMTGRPLDDLSSPHQHACGAVPEPGKWVHLVGVYDAPAREMRVYADGQRVGTRGDVDLWQANGPLIIGAQTLDPVAGLFPGVVDEVRVFQGAAGDGQVTNWYADQAPQPPGSDPVMLAGDWRMDDQAGVFVFDHTWSGNDGALSGGATWPPPEQAYGGVHGVSFDGQTGAVTTWWSPILSDEPYSVSAWVNLTDKGQDRTAVAVAGQLASASSLGYDAGADRFCFTMVHDDQVGAPVSAACADQPPQTGVWTHLVGVFDKRERLLQLYVNGQPAGSATYSGLELWQAAGPVVIGRDLGDGAATAYWSGGVALVRLYQGPMNPAAVAALHQEQYDPTPTAVITAPTESQQWSAGEQITVSGHGYDLAGQLPPTALSWRITSRDCEDPADGDCNVEVLHEWTGTSSGSFAAPDRSDPVHLQVELSVDNGSGLTSSAVTQLEPATVTITLAAEPAELELELSAGPTTAATPFSMTVVQGSTIELSAPEPQEVDEVFYLFSQWAHGSDNRHDIVVPGEAATFTAVYEELDRSPTAVVDFPDPELSWIVGDEVSFGGHASDQLGQLPESTLSWLVVAHRCVDEYACDTEVIGEWNGVSGGTFETPDIAYLTYLEIELTADNGPGWLDTAAVQLDPQTVQLTFVTEPSGLELTVAGQDDVAPFTVTAVQGSSLDIGAPVEQEHDGVTYEFIEWDHGGAGDQTIIVPAVASTFTATYETVQAGSGSVSGTVWCSPTGQLGDGYPVANARITVAGLETFTDINGWFAIQGIPAGVHTLTATPRSGYGCSSRSVTVTIVDGQVTSVAVFLPSGTVS